MIHSIVTQAVLAMPLLFLTKNENLLPIPNRLIVLTFDDGNKSDITYVAPLLKRYGFGATFYVTDGFGRADNKERRLSWEEIKSLHEDGFEIGNHTGSHPISHPCLV